MILITGANGHIGKIVCRHLQRKGVALAAAVRDPEAFRLGKAFSWQLGLPLPSLSGATAVLHLASASTEEGSVTPEEAARLDIEGSRLIRDQIQAERERRRGEGEAGCRFVFVSSQSARSEAENAYGRAKYTVEQLLTDADDVIVRPGLVFGTGLGDSYAFLRRAITVTPVLVVPRTRAAFQPINVEELADALCQLCTAPIGHHPPDPQGASRRIWELGDPIPLRFDELASAVARRAGQRRPILVVPAFVFSVLASVLAVFPATRQFGDRVFGVLVLRAMADSAGSLAELALTPSPIAPRRHTRGRRVLEEARAVLAYCLAGVPPSFGTLRALVRWSAHQTDQPVGLPRIAMRLPSLLRFVEPYGARAEGSRGRLFHAGLLISHASREAFAYIRMFPSRSISDTTTRLLRLAAFEGVTLPFRLLAPRGTDRTSR